MAETVREGLDRAEIRFLKLKTYSGRLRRKKTLPCGENAFRRQRSKKTLSVAESVLWVRRETKSAWLRGKRKIPNASPLSLPAWAPEVSRPSPRPLRMTSGPVAFLSPPHLLLPPAT